MQVKNPVEIGAVVAALRHKHGIRQEELALVAGTGLRFITELEHGKPTLQLGKVLRALAALGVVVEFRLRDGSPVPGPGPDADTSKRRVRRAVRKS